VQSLEAKPFRPHPLFRNGHAQTIVAFAWPRYLTTLISDSSEERLFQVEAKVHLLARCHWQTNPALHPTLLLVHGLEGSSSSKYMFGTAEKAFGAGFNAIRMNLRSCGGTERLTPSLYHGGMSGDLRAVVKELVERDHLPSIFLVGFSMGGNIVLKLAGEEASTLPTEVSAFCAVSPAVDLSSCAEAIGYRSTWVYERYFLRSLRRRLRIKHELYPELYDTSELYLVRTIRDFDERYTAHHGGFKDAADYYRRASALPFIKHIQRPTLIIHAQDDPFVPFRPLNHSSVLDNSSLRLLAPEHGGHVGFVANQIEEQDRFWAENRIVEFCQLIHQSSADPTASSRTKTP
jgi:predicted alpha/beta-fold hydrolase